MPKDVIVKIGIVGDYTEDDVKHISKGPGRINSHNSWKTQLKIPHTTGSILVYFTKFVHRKM